MWLNDCILFEECKDKSCYHIVTDDPKVSLQYPTLDDSSSCGSEMISTINSSLVQVNFNMVFNEKNIYSELLNVINSDNVKTIEKDIHGFDDVKLSEIIYEQIGVASSMIRDRVNYGSIDFIILNKRNEYLFKLYMETNIFSQVRLKIIVDDNIDVIIVGRKADQIHENALVCFHDNKYMDIPIPSEHIYKNFVIIDLYDSLERRKLKIKKLLENV